jgi:hypothetical protein
MPHCKAASFMLCPSLPTIRKHMRAVRSYLSGSFAVVYDAPQMT